MNLRETIRKVLNENVTLLPQIRRRINFDEKEVINYLRKFSIRVFEPDKNIEKILEKSCRNTAYEILSQITDIYDSLYHRWEDNLTYFLVDKYGERVKDFIQNFYNESGDDSGTVYIFRKHEEKNGNNGGRGFSQSFSTWNGLLKEYADWFPSLDWADIKETLDSMPDRKQLLIVEPGDKINTMGYYFSLVKIKRDENLYESTDDKYAVIEITKPSSRMASKWYFQAVPLNKTKEDKIYIKRGPAGILTISTKNIKIHKIFKKSEKEEMDKYLEKLRKSQEEIKEGLHDTSWVNDGDKVTLMDLLNATEDIPVENISVEELKPHLLTWGGDEEESKKIDKADLQYPILIFVDNDGEFISIIDGHHRAQKAVRKGLKTIKAKIIPINSLPKDIRKVFGHMGKLNESLSLWFRRRFDIDELDDLVKDVKDQIEEGQTMIDAIYDTVRQFIATKQFNDIDNAGTEQEYWDSYLVYEKPLIKFVKEKLGLDKEEMTEAELTEKCWKGYTQKGMKTMFGKRYPNCVKKTK